MRQTKAPSARRLALDMLLAVIDRGESLSAVSARLLPRIADGRDRAFAYRLVLDTLRPLNRLSWIRDQLLERPFKGKDSDVATLLLLGIAQLNHPELAVHASIHETVETARTLKKPWAVGLTNAVLRNYQRQSAQLNANADVQEALYHTHPRWLIEQFKQDWPSDWQTICTANNIPAQLCLRLKPDCDRDAFLAQLPEDHHAIAHPTLPNAVLLDSTDITQLPLFQEGQWSVQDAHAQWAGILLDPQPNERILDACAAPGGKTTHLLERTHNQALVTALDIEASRIGRIQENLTRLQLNATIMTADAAQPDTWWDGQAFDRILLDAPCSATGIIRRHPDIKWHRKPQDISSLIQTQATLLDRLWALLAVKGTLLYATCSVLSVENSQQIRQFLARTPDARLLPLDIPLGNNTGYGTQLLPTHANSGDGFFYALLRKG